MKKIDLKDDAQREVFDMVYTAFTNQGNTSRKVEDKENKGEFKIQDENFSVKDLMTNPDVTRFLPTVVEQVVREAVEPALLIIPNLFEEIQMDRGNRIQIGALGSLVAAEVPEGTEYREQDIQMDGGDMISINIKKHGLMIRVTDEMITDNQFDVIGLWLRHAGRALARHKELYAIRLIDEFGTEVFNNVTPSDSLYGVTTGRDITGASNGSMTANDIWDMYAELLHRGFTPDTVLMHPLQWRMFMTDSEMREQVLDGATLATRQMPAGQTAMGFGTSHQGLGLRTIATGQPTLEKGQSEKLGAASFLTTLNALGNTYQIQPRFTPTPLTVLVTPHVPYTPPAASAASPFSGRANVVMVDSNNAGLLITRDPVSTEEFDDPARDIRALKIKERYGFGFVEQGKSLTVARNVAIARNYVFENANNVTLGNIDSSVATLT